jgi:hypothetical protein
MANTNRDHEIKKEMARKMLTNFERKNGTPIFQSCAWVDRQDARAKKQNRAKIN